MNAPRQQNRFIEWIDHRLPIFTLLKHELDEYPTPRNLNYLWNFGLIAGVTLVIMIATGIVLAMFGSILVLFFLPWLDTSTVRSGRFRPIYRQFVWTFVADCVLLTYAGGQPPEGTWLLIGRIGAAYYFLHFLVIIPLVGLAERPSETPFKGSQSAIPAG